MQRGRARPAIGVTGAAAGLGRALLEHLAGSGVDARLVGIDSSSAEVDGVEWRHADVRDARLHAHLGGIETVVHLATTYDGSADASSATTLNVTGTANLLEAAREAGVRRVVLTTSVDVFGAIAGNPVPLPDDAQLRAAAGPGLLGDHVEIERLAAHAARAGLRVVVLRPATLVGGRLGPSYDGTMLRQLSSPRLLAVRGVEPLWQLCHVDDLVSALALAASGTITRSATVACDGWLEQSVVEQLAGKRRVELPARVALGTAERLHRAGVTAASPRELDRLLAPVVVGSDRLRSAGWSPAWTNESALLAHLAERPEGADSRAGAYTAAGATVALLGTAALVRRARRRRGL